MNEKKASKQTYWGIKAAYNCTKKLKKRRIPPALMKRMKYETLFYKNKQKIAKLLLKKLCSNIEHNSICSQQDCIDLLIEIALHKIIQDTKDGLKKN